MKQSKFKRGGWVIYKGFRIDWSPRCGAWKVVHKDSLPHGAISYMLMDYPSLAAAKRFVDSAVA